MILPKVLWSYSAAARWRGDSYRAAVSDCVAQEAFRNNFTFSGKITQARISPEILQDAKLFSDAALAQGQPFVALIPIGLGNV